MTASHEITSQPRRYHLATFGTLALVGPGNDTVLGTHGHHRRRLALLAVLAAAGERGRSRDQLLLLFWPEATQSRARHSLDQLLYALRGSLGEFVFASVNPVRLDPHVLTSDVAAFMAAVERDDLEAAVQAYRGPFLDGFYLSDAPEFERWVDGERARLAATYATALERLAQTSEATGDFAGAVQWWQKLAEVDPVSSKYASGLVRALVRMGDRAAALRFAERHAAAVTQELGADAAAAATTLVAEVRAEMRSEALAAPSLSAASPTALAPPAGPPVPGSPNEPRSPSVRRQPWRAPYVLAALVAVVAIAAAAFFRATARDRATPESVERSIAVLPLTNVSRDAKDAPLADGLGEELVAVLAKLRGVRVMARTSAGAFRNSETDVRRIGDSLGVDYVLEGGVQRIGSRVRVQVRLVDTRGGSTRWSETYDRELRDIFAVQSDIAEAVGRELDAKLAGNTLASTRRGPTTSIAAYELYLRGNDLATTRGDSAIRAGLAYFRQAIALDSQYAAAYAGLARLTLTRVIGGEDTTTSRREALAIAEAAARRAIALDSTLPEAHMALAGVRRVTLELPAAEAEIRRALALDSTNARLHEWLTQQYAWTGRPAGALAEARRAVALDPLSPNARAELAHALLVNDRCDEALAELAGLRSLRPPLLRAGDFAAQCYARKRMWPEAIAEAQRGASAAGFRRQGLVGFLLARAGRTDEARRILAALLDRARRVEGNAFNVATVYAGLAENEQAIAWLGKAFDERAIPFDNLDLVLNALAPDPRVDAFRQRLGIQKR